jgi:hypothetical protein
MYGTHSKHKTEMSNSCKHLVGKSERRRRLKNLGVNDGIIKRVLKKYDEEVDWI